MLNKLRRIKNLKRIPGALKYAKEMSFNPELIKADIQIHLQKMENEFFEANKIEPIPTEIYNAYLLDFNRIKDYIESSNFSLIKTNKEIQKLMENFDKKHKKVFEMIDERLGDKNG